MAVIRCPRSPLLADKARTPGESGWLLFVAVRDISIPPFPRRSDPRSRVSGRQLEAAFRQKSMLPLDVAQ